MTATLTALTPRTHLAQTEAVNWLLVTGDAGVLLVDAGYPGDRDEVLASLRALGCDAGDVCAVLLTHAHVDHLGSARWLAAAHDTPVYCHADEVGHARREYLEQAAPLAVARQLWRPRWARWTAHVVANGGLNRAGISTAEPLTAEIAAALPGRPRPVPTPGHTGGHCSYLIDGVLASGDALVTGHPLVARGGPQLLPEVFNHDQHNCLRSLSALELLETELLAPGHGPPWRGPIAEAAGQAAARARR